MGFSLANPLPDDTEPPVISIIDLEWLWKSERFVFFFVQQPPDVHVAATTQKLLERLAGNQTFIAQLTEVRCGAAPLGVTAGMLLKHVVALRLAEGAVRSGYGELQHRRWCSSNTNPLNMDGS